MNCWELSSHGRNSSSQDWRKHNKKTHHPSQASYSWDFHKSPWGSNCGYCPQRNRNRAPVYPWAKPAWAGGRGSAQSGYEQKQRRVVGEKTELSRVDLLSSIYLCSSSTLLLLPCLHDFSCLFPLRVAFSSSHQGSAQIPLPLGSLPWCASKGIILFPTIGCMFFMIFLPIVSITVICIVSIAIIIIIICGFKAFFLIQLRTSWECRFCLIYFCEHASTLHNALYTASAP